MEDNKEVKGTKAEYWLIAKLLNKPDATTEPVVTLMHIYPHDTVENAYNITVGVDKDWLKGFFSAIMEGEWSIIDPATGGE